MDIRKQVTVLFCVLMFCYTYVHQNGGANQNSRLDLLHSLFVHRTPQIDAYHTNTIDKSTANGHFYSDKAPGIVFLAIPSFSVSVVILKLIHISLDSRDGWLASSWITTAGSVGLITALGGAAMLVFLAQLVGRRYALISTLVVFLGAAPFPYATMLFSHAAVMGLICIALWAIADTVFWERIAPVHAATDQPTPTRIEGRGELSSQEHCRSRIQAMDNWRNVGSPGRQSAPSPVDQRLGGPELSPHLCHEPRPTAMMRHILAGLCCGLAISSEYTSSPAAAGVLVLALLTSSRRGALVALAAVPSLLLIPLWNWICFDSPAAFGYHRLAESQFQEMNHGFFGIGVPNAYGAWVILLSPERGLLAWTPFFAMGILGIKPLLARAPKLLWVSIIVVVVHTVCISGYYMPNGGRALGPRFLTAMLPFLAILSACGLRLYPRSGIMLGWCSILLTGLGTIIDAMPPRSSQDPLLTYYLPRLLAGQFAHNLGSCLGAPAFFSASLLLFVLLGSYLRAVMRAARIASAERASVTE